ncbi:origin recognition complex protein 6 [Perilla frutescens var. hirtella]|uniref:Origin of replication complex subunit 6 n=1 Tax=Perilla frutescens var. hirtella TaxID=608512 RepID=A0AAD4IMW7_PERFH|nr:origin recognition complex protein 6 [Perilla frutescens var. hirtella]KAH6770654.1 origin recognition complex protein 6 [Perilla frutescens var. hirtella]KAH6815728.1 origin recognition complex protein 6 [Perilla frutescens var. frutescens]
MDMSEIARKLSLSETKQVTRKAAELRRLADIQFDSSIIGVGEICKAVICLEIAASRLGVLFDRHAAIKLSGVSEKAYNRSFNAMQNGIGVKNKLDVRELAIQFGCVRLIPFVHKGLSLYKDRFLASLPPSRRASTDFNRPVFTAVAFYLCAKRHKLKADKFKLIELAGTSESEFSSVSTSMLDLCFDIFGIAKEKKDSRKIKGNRELVDALPEKRMLEDGGYSSSDGEESPAYKKRKQMDKHDHDEWKLAVLKSNKVGKAEAAVKLTKSRQTRLDFKKRAPETTAAEAS